MYQIKNDALKIHLLYDNSGLLRGTVLSISHEAAIPLLLSKL